EGKPFDRNLVRFREDVEKSARLRQQRLDRKPATIAYDDELPISSRREEIAAAIRDNPVVIVCGETGSGKSTQLPKICLDLGRGIDGMIGHTQPRRIAARSVATRIAQELGGGGGIVGSKVRFSDETGPHTLIKLLTDGMLLAESQRDRFLDQYDTLIIDEAHERSLNIDFLMGYVKRLLPRRPELRVIITSATIDAARFAEHFATERGPAPVLEVSGRTFPVEVRYRPPETDEEGDEPDIPEQIAAALDEIARDEPGDVLVFLPTEHAIHDTAKHLRGGPSPGRGRAGHRTGPQRETEILPLYARLTGKEQQRVFEAHTHRRIVLATNVAESSLTVPGIRAVIDTGTARISRYSVRSKVQRLPIESVSQASANQRAGRCGRVGPGICVRLYAEDDYTQREAYTQPEIQRTNLAAVILQAKSMQLGELEDFPFLDPPKPEAIRDGYKTLFELGAIDDKRELTPIGRQLAKLPVDPRIGRMILAARDEGCLHEVLIIAAALEIQDPRDRPLEKQQQADEAHARFANETSDFLSELMLWEFYHGLKEKLSKNQLRKACQQNFLSAMRMWEWVDVHRQLVEVVDREGLRDGGKRIEGRRDRGIEGKRQEERSAHRDSHGRDRTKGRPSSTSSSLHPSVSPSLNPPQRDSAAIHRALLTGLLSNIAQLTDGGPEEPQRKNGPAAKDAPPQKQRVSNAEYTAAGGGKFVLWPGSGVFARKPKWVMAAELVETTRRYLRTVSRIDPAWIEPLAPHLVTKTHSDPHWSRAASSVMANERVSLFGLVIVPRRSVRYGGIDPAKSREMFIQHALLEGEFDTPGKFLEHNRALVESLKHLQTKSRRFDFLPEDEVLFEFYDQRLPPDVFDGQRFEAWRRKAEAENPQVLLMTEADVIQKEVEEVSATDFPDAISVRQMNLPLEYRYEPGTASDGITLSVPREALNQLDPRRLGWLVPGLLEEKISAMIKSLPKELRRHFVPVPDTAKRVLRDLKFGEGDLSEAVADVLRKISGEVVPVQSFQVERLPDHLRMNVRVTDAKGESVAAARNLDELRQKLGAEAAASFSNAETGQWNRDGLTDWDFDTLPTTVDVVRGGVAMKGYPAIIDRGESVSLRLVDDPHKAAFLSRAGVRRLFSLTCRRDLKSQVDWLPNMNQLQMLSMTLPKPAESTATKGGAPNGSAAPKPPVSAPSTAKKVPAPAQARVAGTEALRRPGASTPHAAKTGPSLRSEAAAPSPSGSTSTAAATPDASFVGDFRQQLADLIADRAFFESAEIPQTAHQFKERVRQARNRLSVAVQDVAQVIGPIMTAYQQARKEAERSHPNALDYVFDDVRRQIALLVEPGFLTSTRWEWLNQYPRYFKAIVARLSRLAGDGIHRDRKLHAQVEPRWRAFLERLFQHRTRDLYDPHLIHYRWMLEEYRVSLFAQSLGTGIAVSEKRLEEQWAKLRP
ncbi:MAG: ATP-dependent RNA helicase HrpA, partial [Planctomycetaceae bacterium]|nr:ATP-dependent RNA helicase HrpA [Planctomycetaceae bacterium]